MTVTVFLSINIIIAEDFNDLYLASTSNSD